MKYLVPIVACSFISHLSAAEAPKIFAGLLQPNVAVKGQIGAVMPPLEIEKFVRKVEISARKEPKWFREFSAQSKPGEPLPFDERLGLTKSEYDEYIAMWAKREFKPTEEVTLLLRPGSGDTWTLNATGKASNLSIIHYHPKDDVFRSPNGEMKRIENIKTDASSVLGEWSGMEWKLEDDTGLGKIKENLAIGFFADAKHGLVVYRAQEISTEGKRLLDQSLIIRFPLAKGAKPELAKINEKPAEKTVDKPAEKPVDKPAPVKVKPKIVPQP